MPSLSHHYVGRYALFLFCKRNVPITRPIKKYIEICIQLRDTNPTNWDEVLSRASRGLASIIKASNIRGCGGGGREGGVLRSRTNKKVFIAACAQSTNSQYKLNSKSLIARSQLVEAALRCRRPQRPDRLRPPLGRCRLSGAPPLHYATSLSYVLSLTDPRCSGPFVSRLRFWRNSLVIDLHFINIH